MRKPIAILILLLVVALGGTLIWLWHRASPPGKVTVSFQGFTNDNRGLRLATFCISNGTGGAIKRWGHCGVESPQTSWVQRPQSGIGPAVILKRGQAEFVSVAAPTNSGAWKAVLFYSRDGWRCRLNDGYGVFRFVPQRFRMGVPTDVWQSQWLDQ